jgi:hypothetical protein
VEWVEVIGVSLERAFGWKGAGGMGGVGGTGVLRCAQDDGKNKQRQEQTTARTNNSKDNSRSPAGMTTKEATATAKIMKPQGAKYRDLSTARRTMRLSVAAVEMTCFFPPRWRARAVGELIRAER